MTWFSWKTFFSTKERISMKSRYLTIIVKCYTKLPENFKLKALKKANTVTTQSTQKNNFWIYWKWISHWWFLGKKRRALCWEKKKPAINHTRMRGKHSSERRSFFRFHSHQNHHILFCGWRESIRNQTPLWHIVQLSMLL